MDNNKFNPNSVDIIYIYLIWFHMYTVIDKYLYLKMYIYLDIHIYS